MTTRTPPEPATPKRTSILRALATRLLAYALLAAIVLCSLIDFSSLYLTTPTAPPRSNDPATSAPGWPNLAGPHHDSHSAETNLADAWPPAGPPVLWNRPIGAGYSGLIARAGRAYTQSQSLTGQSLLALDADTGQPLWEHRYAWPYQPGGMFPGPRATPTLSDNRIYFAAPDGQVGCLDADTGHPRWSLDLLKTFNARPPAFGYACSPVIVDGMLIFPVGGPAASVVALDARSGATRWASGSATASYCSPLPITFRGRRQLAVFLQNALAGFDLQTGRLLWQQAYDRGFDEHAAALIYDEPYLRATQAYRAGADLYQLEPGPPDQTIDGVPACHLKRLRHDPQMSNDVAATVLVDGYLYGFDLHEMQASPRRPSRGTFRCIDAATGQVRWSSDAPGQAAIIVADRKLLMLNDSGQALLLRANPDRYEELARADVFPGETCWTAPALDGGRLLLRSPTRAACLFVGKPDRMTPRQQAQAATAAAAPKSTATDLTWLLGAEREFPFELPDARELTRWYLYSLAAFAAAAFFSMIAARAATLLPTRSPRPSAPVLFCAALVGFGIIATPLANRYATPFIFTWPLALIAIHQLALAIVSNSNQRQPTPRAANWPSLAATALLILTCIVYFKLTRQLSLAPAWYFLLTLPAAWPLALPAARTLLRPPNSLPTQILRMLAVFSLYFWAAGAAMLLRTAYL